MYSHIVVLFKFFIKKMELIFWSNKCAALCWQFLHFYLQEFKVQFLGKQKCKRGADLLSRNPPEGIESVNVFNLIQIHPIMK